MTAGKSTKSVAKGRKLAVKISEADKWKPRTDFKKERQTLPPKFRSTASWLGPLDLFKQDYLKEFREKNPKDKKSSDEAVLRKASDVWRSLSNSEKASYEARAFTGALEYRMAVSKNATPSDPN